MLKVTRATAPDSDGAVLLRLEGQVAGRWVPELRRVCQEAAGSLSGGRLALDLSDVLFVDADGAALLRGLLNSGAALRNCSMFVSEQLKEVAHDVR